MNPPPAMTSGIIHASKYMELMRQNHPSRYGTADTLPEAARPTTSCGSTAACSSAPRRSRPLPGGSVYTDRECVVFGTSTLALRAWMRGRGIARLVDDKTPEDHIGLMLSLMTWIARNQPDDLDEFLQAHLLTWSLHSLDQLIEAAAHPFYESLARLAKATLEGVQQVRGLDVSTASVLVFAGLFVMRFAFYMMPMTYGISL